MKKSLFLMTFALAAINLFAQGEPGSISFIPRLGTCISNVTGNKLSYMDNSVYKSRNKAGFMGGLDVEYVMNNNLSMTIGGYYSMQGYRFPDHKVSTGENKYEGYSNNHCDMEYINIPVMLNYYIVPGLAVKGGGQVAYLLSAHDTYETTPFSVDDEGKKTYGTTVKYDDKSKSGMRRFDVSIPLGVSYEYMNVVLDARYNIGLYNIHSKKLNILKNQNRFFTLTVGYRLKYM